MLVPKLATTLKGYTRQQFLTDLAAGVIVGIMALLDVLGRDKLVGTIDEALERARVLARVA